jgi:hypothetical protein
LYHLFDSVSDIFKKWFIIQLYNLFSYIFFLHIRNSSDNYKQSGHLIKGNVIISKEIQRDIYTIQYTSEFCINSTITLFAYRYFFYYSQIR